MDTISYKLYSKKEEFIQANTPFQVLSTALNAGIFTGELLGITEEKSIPFGDVVQE